MRNGMWKVLALAAFSLSLTGCVGCTRIGPGYVGIKVQNLGTGKGVNDIPALTGWVTYNIFTESVLEYPTFVQTAVWTKNPNEGKAVNEEITFTTKDSLQVAADISLAYSLVQDKVPHFYVKFRSDDLDRFTHGFLRNLARQEFDDNAGHYSIDQIMGDNGPFLREVRANLQKDVEGIGVRIEQFGFIGAPRPPQAVIDSINAKVQATQIAIRKQNEIVQSEADAKKEVARAEGEARAILVVAEAQAKANRLLAESLTATLIENKKIEKWNGVNSQVVAGGGGVLVNMGK